MAKGNGLERSYWPANGREGLAFMALWCDRCKRHELYERTEAGEDECIILLRSLCNRPADILYPPEWVTTGHTVEAAVCTAYEPRELERRLDQWTAEPLC